MIELILLLDQNSNNIVRIISNKELIKSIINE